MKKFRSYLFFSKYKNVCRLRHNNLLIIVIEATYQHHSLNIPNESFVGKYSYNYDVLDFVLEVTLNESLLKFFPTKHIMRKILHSYKVVTSQTQGSRRSLKINRMQKNIEIKHDQKVIENVSQTSMLNSSKVLQHRFCFEIGFK